MYDKIFDISKMMAWTDIVIFCNMAPRSIVGNRGLLFESQNLANLLSLVDRFNLDTSLDYPINLINSVINKFWGNIDNIDAAKSTSNDSSTIMVPLPFKDQQSANSVKKQMQILSANIGVKLSLSSRLRRLSQILALKENKPPIVNNQCVVYKFECDL